MDSVQRILALMEEKNITAAALSREISLTNGLITQWKQGKQRPSVDAIVKLAQYFEVSTDYLLLGKEENTVSQIGSNADLSTDEADLLSYFRVLSRRNQRAILVQMENMINQEKEQATTKQGKYLA